MSSLSLEIESSVSKLSGTSFSSLYNLEKLFLDFNRYLGIFFLNPLEERLFGLLGLERTCSLNPLEGRLLGLLGTDSLNPVEGRLLGLLGTDSLNPVEGPLLRLLGTDSLNPVEGPLLRLRGLSLRKIPKLKILCLNFNPPKPLKAS